MKNKDLIKRLGTVGIAVGLCAAVSVGTTFAYYTDATHAQGSVPYSVAQPSTEIDETPEGTNKNIVVENTSDAAVLVRVKLLYAQSNAAVTIGEGTGDGWYVQDGWYYYTTPLWNKGDRTTSLIANVDPVDSNSIKAFNVTVVQQCVELQWDEETESYAGAFAGMEKPLSVKSLTTPVKIGDKVEAIGTAVVVGSQNSAGSDEKAEAGDDAAKNESSAAESTESTEQGDAQPADQGTTEGEAE